MNYAVYIEVQPAHWSESGGRMRIHAPGSSAAFEQSERRLPPLRSVPALADMRCLTLTLLLLCCTSCQHTRSYSHSEEADRTNDLEPVNLGLSEFEGALYFFQTTQAALDDAPRWARGAEFPPLSPRKAMVVALREAERIRPDVSKWNMESISLLQCGNEKDECWVYSVRFWRGDVPYAGLPFYLDVPVLMDGAAVRGIKNLR